MRDTTVAVSASRANPNAVLDGISFTQLMARALAPSPPASEAEEVGMTIWNTAIGVHRHDDAVEFLFEVPKEFCQHLIAHTHLFFNDIFINGNPLVWTKLENGDRAVSARHLGQLCHRADAGNVAISLLSRRR